MRGTTQRVALTTIDQAVSSLASFSLSFLVLRSVSTPAFGAFTVAATLYTLSLSGARALAAEPLLVRFTARELPTWRHGAADATGAAFVVGLAAGAATACAALVMRSGGDHLGAALLAIALGLPFLLLQDVFRHAFFAAGRPGQALVNDLTWFGVQTVAVVGVFVLDERTTFAFIMAWSLGAAVATGVGVVQLGSWPNVTRTRTWFREHRDLAFRFFGETGLEIGSTQVTFLAVGALASLGDLGRINGARVLLGPVGVLFLAAMAAAVPEAVRRIAVGPSAALLPLAATMSAVLAIAPLLWAVVLVRLPDEVGRTVLGSAWSGTGDVVAPIAVLFAADGAAYGPRAVLRALGSARRSLRTRRLIAPLTVAFGIAGCVADGARGAGWGLAAASAVGVVAWWRAALVETRTSERPSAERRPEATRTTPDAG